MHMEVKVTMTGVKIKGSQDNPCEVQAKRGQNRGSIYWIISNKSGKSRWNKIAPGVGGVNEQRRSGGLRWKGTS